MKVYSIRQVSSEHESHAEAQAGVYAQGDSSFNPPSGCLLL
jgi:hypothetical protein